MYLPMEKNQAKTSKKAKDMGIKEIRDQISQLVKENVDPLPLKVELYRKITLSFSSIVFILLGFGIAGSVRHKEKNINIGICILVGMFYYFFTEGLDLGKILAVKEVLPIFLAMWTPNLIFLTAGSYFSYKICAS